LTRTSGLERIKKFSQRGSEMSPYVFIVLALGLRFVSKPIAFTSVSAALLFFGARGSRKYAWIPWVLAVATDVALNKFVYSYPITWDLLVTWAWYAAVLGLGMQLRNSNSPLRIGGASLLSSLTFFVVSNFAVWASYRTLYPATVQGLGNCYTAAIPFFRHTLTADLVFTAIFFSIPVLLHGTAGDLEPAPEWARKRR
jgi:hypothetical protein